MSEKLQRNLRFCFGSVSIFRPKSGISAGTAGTLPILPRFKSVRNENLSVLFQLPIRKISALRYETNYTGMSCNSNTSWPHGKENVRDTKKLKLLGPMGGATLFFLFFFFWLNGATLFSHGFPYFQLFLKIYLDPLT